MAISCTESYHTYLPLSQSVTCPNRDHAKDLPSWNTPLLTGIIIVRARVVLVCRRKRDRCLFKVPQSESMVRPHLFTQLIMLKEIG